MTQPHDDPRILRPVDSKADLRREIRARRATRDTSAAQTATALATTALTMPAIADASAVALYASRRGEPGTDRLRAALRARGVRVLLPVVLAQSRLAWIEDDGEVSPGIRPPGANPAAEHVVPTLADDVLTRVEVVLVPALAVDTRGGRLGQGGGYYDRELGRLTRSGPLLIAVVHDDEVRDADLEGPLPTEPHDVRVDGALTPSRWLMAR